MFNLLPDNLRKAIKVQYNARRFVVALSLLIFVQVSFFVMLVPTWVSLSYKERAVESESEKMNQYLSTLNIGPVTTLIKSLNQKMLILESTLEYPKVEPFINSIIAKKTSTISIKEFDYTSSDKDSAVITLQGMSVTREALVAYVKRLEALGVFASVDLPISNLAKDKNISFLLTLIVEPLEPKS